MSDDNKKKYTDDPAFKFIKNSSSEYQNKIYDWKKNLNPEEKKFYDSHPLPFLASKAENYSLFKKRYEKSKKEPSVPIPLSQKIKTSFNKNKNDCPKCGSKVNLDEKFCGECGFSLENLVSKDFEKETYESIIEDPFSNPLEEDKKKNKSSMKEKMTNLMCSECGYPLNSQEDIFCPECGCKVIYQSDEVNSEDNPVQNLDEEESTIFIEETKKVPTSHNDLPIDILVDLKSFFEEKLINEDEYNHLRKSALKISKDSDSMNGLGKIRSISREKLTELRTLFNERLIDQDEYDDLRKNLIEIE